MKNRNSKILGNVFALLLVGFLFYFTFYLGYSAGKKGINLNQTALKGQPANLDFSLYWEAWNKFKEKSVAPVDDTKAVYGSISGLLQSSGDAYTVFFSPEENKRFKEDINGKFDGVGIELVQKNSLPVVVAPLSKSPAEAAGIKSGDIIMEVDGTKTSSISFNEVINKIRGTAGSKVKIKIAREGADQPIEYELTRQTIVVDSVEWQIKESSGKRYMYVKIRQFGDDTDKLFGQFVDATTKAKPDGIIVDLRNDPGGYLETSINLSSYFLDGGNVVLEEGRNNQRKEYKTTQRAKLKDYKLVVLVNKGSASASEIFSGAIQDRKAGKIIGEKTFGKGSVQEFVELSDGSAVKITVAKWLTPNGRQINDEGIAPDIEVSESEGKDAVLDRALEYLKTDK